MLDFLKLSFFKNVFKVSLQLLLIVNVMSSISTSSNNSFWLVQHCFREIWVVLEHRSLSFRSHVPLISIWNFKDLFYDIIIWQFRLLVFFFEFLFDLFNSWKEFFKTKKFGIRFLYEFKVLRDLLIVASKVFTSWVRVNLHLFEGFSLSFMKFSFIFYFLKFFLLFSLFLKCNHL